MRWRAWRLLGWVCIFVCVRAYACDLNNQTPQREVLKFCWCRAKAKYTELDHQSLIWLHAHSCTQESPPPHYSSFSLICRLHPGALLVNTKKTTSLCDPPDVETKKTRGEAPVWLLKLRQIGLKDYLRKRSFLGWFVGLVLPSLGCSSRPSTKYLFPHRTLFLIHLSSLPRKLGRQLCRVAFLLISVSGGASKYLPLHSTPNWLKETSNDSLRNT